MVRFTIYCTEEQTKKALEFGAPIEVIVKNHKGNVTTDSMILNGDLCRIPTSEQMIGWLEIRKIFIYIIPCYGISCSWYIASKGYNKYGYTSNVMVCKTRKEATLEAIDAALEYLQKKEE